MRVVVQRVSEASVAVGGEEVSRIGRGLLALVAAGLGDTDEDVAYVAEKVVNLRIFADADDKMNLSLLDAGGELLAVSQFTLYGDCRKGRRPSFTGALEPVAAKALFDEFVRRAESLGARVRTGVFRENMQVRLVNDGPVTMLIDSNRSF